jgi:hypothetical protein
MSARLSIGEPLPRLGVEAAAKFFECERFPESVHDLAGEFALQSDFDQLPREQRLFIDGIWNLTRLGEEPGGIGYVDPIIRMDGTGSKGDGRNVPFPGGAEAENEAQRASWNASLVGVRNDGRIEQRGGFERVFGEEIRADQQPSLFGDFMPRRQIADLFKALEESLA